MHDVGANVDVPQLGASSAAHHSESRPCTPQKFSPTPSTSPDEPGTPRNVGSNADVPSTSQQQSASSGQPQNALTHIVANNLATDIRRWWENQENGQDLLDEKNVISNLLFAKVKHPVPQDLWIDGQAQEVTAVVSTHYVLHQIRDVVEERQQWLQGKNLPLDLLMRDGPGKERTCFVDHCKGKYHATPHQRSLQEQDKISGKIVQQGKHSRWSRELQRRAGSKVLWEIISFTGRFDHQLLQRAVEAAKKPIRTGACQPDASRKATAAANRARDALRWGQTLDKQRARGKKHFSWNEQWYLTKFDDDTFRENVNAATKAVGHGRLRHKDGSTSDIGNHLGGISRTVLDDYQPPLIPSSDEER
jgi:hypothetical protein